MWQVVHKYGTRWDVYRDIHVRLSHYPRDLMVYVPGICNQRFGFEYPRELAGIIGPEAAFYLQRSTIDIYCCDLDTLKDHIMFHYKKRAEVCMRVLPQPIAEEICEYL